MKDIKTEIKEWVQSIVIAIILALFIRTFFIQAFKIPTGSMKPTLLVGDHILVNKFIYGAKVPFTESLRLPGISKPRRGDVIVFMYPKDTKKDFIKRLVAFEGEHVEIANGDIYINGKLLDKDGFRNIYYYNRGNYAEEGRSVIVPDGHYFVLGDNSSSSRDSRYWGFVPQKNLIGKAQVIYWPLNRIRLIK